jgi:hypothetical protein
VWGGFLLISLALFQYAGATLMVHLPGKSPLDAVRWSYAVVSLVVLVVAVGFRLVNAQLGSLPALMLPMVGAIDSFVLVDKLIVGGFLVLVSAGSWHRLKGMGARVSEGWHR